MADIADVQQVLAAFVSAALYPNGTGAPSAAGAPIVIYPGWPLPSQLDQDLAALQAGTGGKAHVSIFPVGAERNTTRYVPKQLVQAIAQPTLALTLSGLSLTLSGTIPNPFVPHNLAVLAAGKAWIYPLQPADTLTSAAAGLASLIPGATSSGAVITLTSTPEAVRVGTVGTVGTEWERQAQNIQITVWAPDPTTRSKIGQAIKVALSQVAFLTMPDGFGARVRSVAGSLSDEMEKIRIYKRDLVYEVEYATTVVAQVPTVVVHQTTLDAQGVVAFTEDT